MDVRAERAGDRDAIRAVHRAAFEREDEARLVDALREDSAFVPDLSLVAEVEGRIIGHALFTRLGLSGGEGDPRLLALAPVAVLPEEQQRGVGSLLIREGLALAAALGFRGVVVLGHPEYYPRFGFVPASVFGLTCPFPAPAEAFMAVPLWAESLDGLEGAVVYPPPFGLLEREQDGE